MPKEKKRASSCELLEDLMCTRTHTSIAKRGRRRGFVCWGPSEKGAKVNARDTQQETHAHTTPFFSLFFSAVLYNGSNPPNSVYVFCLHRHVALHDAHLSYCSQVAAAAVAVLLLPFSFRSRIAWWIFVVSSQTFDQELSDVSF